MMTRTKRGRGLMPGNQAITDFNVGRRTLVEIVERREHSGSQSGIQFRVSPPLWGGYPKTWYDADWFEPA